VPLPVPEADIVAALSAQAAASIGDLAVAPWAQRAAAATRLLEGIHAGWWSRHLADAAAYDLDLAKLNELAEWEGEYAQVSSTIRGGVTYLTPPKFFGGNAAQLREDFVLSVSLNHAMPKKDDYIDELIHLQAAATCLESHRDYFQQPYAYKFFFSARAKLLAAYADGRGHEHVEMDWRQRNTEYALYLERYPTISSKCSTSAAPHDVLEEEVFVMALNAIVHRIVMGLLRPRATLLAGRATWELLPHADPEDMSLQVRPNQGPICPVTLDSVPLLPDGPPCTVVRSNFLRTVYGPNSDAELAAVGMLLA